MTQVVIAHLKVSTLRIKQGGLLGELEYNLTPMRVMFMPHQVKDINDGGLVRMIFLQSL
jgi:hypothetical protein